MTDDVATIEYVMANNFTADLIILVMWQTLKRQYLV